MSLLDPLLPPELEKSIFYLCALTDPKMISVLISVSRRVKEWVEPLRFRSFHFQRRKASRLSSLIYSKSNEFLAQHVHHFILGSSVSLAEYHGCLEILPICTSIRDLALFEGGWADTYAQLPKYPYLRYLTLSTFGSLKFLEFLEDNPLFILQITHLHATWTLLVPLEALIPSQLPKLSHITGEWLGCNGMSDESVPEEVETVSRMLEWEQIQQFVLCVNPGSSYWICEDRARSIWYHAKVVKLQSNWADESLEDSWIGRTGTLGFWDCAERIARPEKKLDDM